MKRHVCVSISFFCLLINSFAFAHPGGGFRGGPPPHRGFSNHGNHQHGNHRHHGYQHHQHNDDYHHGGRDYQKHNDGYGGNNSNWGNDDRW
ncbi:hypothetical protein [Legionella rowbothamii]|uniref:hypothetical protein n=1 Tax=Legionella rowbothamii TaxID=96229 RepID=UPI001056B29C|nr:hypothetical protein [Legionella rowbothamii]